VPIGHSWSQMCGGAALLAPDGNGKPLSDSIYDGPQIPRSNGCDLKTDDATMTHDSFFGLSIYGLQLHFRGGGPINGFAGAAWRGLMGGVLHSAVCSYPSPVCAPCPSLGTCVYPTLFKPTVEAMLPPFWLHGWQRVTNGWVVGIRWIGRNRDYAVGEWLGALAHASNGFSIGSKSVQLDHAVSAVTGQLLWCRQQGWSAAPESMPWAKPYPASQSCRVKFFTPMVSKHAGNPLFGALQTRVQRLVLQHGDGGQLPRPERPWNCRVVEHHVHRVALSKRFLSGSLWCLDLSDIDADAWNLLSAGLELHAGGQTGLGCGHYDIV
jgi:hypothetical protein